MTYNPFAMSALAADVVSFENAIPTTKIWVSPTGSDSNSGGESSPLKTIQAAVKVAMPGTAIMVKEGTYTENVDLLGRSGTADKPIWIVSADGKGAANIVAKSADAPVLLGYGVSNVVIKGFELVGGTEGIKLTQSGNTLTKLVNKVVIEDNIIHGQSIDGIKTAQSVNTAIVGNTVYNIKTQEGIDNVYMRNGVIANNEVYDVQGLSGIVVKAGSSNVKILDNYLHQVPDGILVGGFSSGQGSIFPYGIMYEAKNVLVEGNMVVDATKHALNVYGAVDSWITENSLANVSKVSVINVGTDNLGYVSTGIQLVDNIVSKTYWLTATANSVSVSSGNGLT
jgi:Right handed beta helix region